ncbi:MAG: leucyl aminopeptidase [Proteobacteria bacterium]|nr:leucyl aminopeptidase [Pseudomonadota bacterium]
MNSSHDKNPGQNTADQTFFSHLPDIWHVLSPDHLTFQDQGTGPLVVPYTYKKKEKSLAVLTSHSLNPQVSEQLEQCLTAGNGTTKTHEFFADGRQYILHPLPNQYQDYSTDRLSREWGLSLVSYFSDLLYYAESLSFASSSSLSYPHVLDGMVQGLYQSSGLKSRKNDKKVTLSSLAFDLEGQQGDHVADQMKDMLCLAKAKVVTRHLGDTPSNYLTPEAFAQVAVALGDEFNFKVTLYDETKMKDMGMNALLSVAQGSPNRPQMILCEITGQNNDKPVVFVGKGVTFDSGGISLKPPASMHEMKYDMLGGGTVLGAMCYLASSKKTLPHSVVALIGCVENMPSRHATRPGDVVTSMGGKSIEILNTDAEGRLVMADLFGYAQKHYDLHFMVDVATLTGACLYALGSVGAALMSTDQKLADYLLESANTVGEPLWQLPLWRDLSKCMASTVADVQNIAAPNVKAGTITAGIFLSEFIEKGTKWAHFDIAGTGWHSQAYGYPKKGASGYGVEILSSAAQHSNNLTSS